MQGVGFRMPALPISMHTELWDGNEEEHLDRERRGLMCYGAEQGDAGMEYIGEKENVLLNCNQ